MDEELQQLEAELKRLRPAAPAPALGRRIGSELHGAAREASQSRRMIWWVAMPAAAAVAWMTALAMRQDAPRQMAAEIPAVVEEDAMFKPVAAENLLYAARDEGLVTLADGTTARRKRLSYVDTITWKNPRTNAELKWSVPREEVRIVPVSFQ